MEYGRQHNMLHNIVGMATDPNECGDSDYQKTRGSENDKKAAKIKITARRCLNLPRKVFYPIPTEAYEIELWFQDHFEFIIWGQSEETPSPLSQYGKIFRGKVTHAALVQYTCEPACSALCPEAFRIDAYM